MQTSSSPSETLSSGFYRRMPSALLMKWHPLEMSTSARDPP
jgi:hypothetical protein